MENTIPETNKSPFYRESEQRPIELPIVPHRLNINGKFVKLTKRSNPLLSIYKALIGALESEWFLNLNNPQHYYSTIYNFIVWINKSNVKDNEIYDIINKFESHRVNNIGVKPQSSGVDNLITVLIKGTFSKYISREDLEFIRRLLLNTTKSKNEDAEPKDLGSWFTKIVWLRNYLNEKDYIQLASPKKLINSLSVTLSKTILDILGAKRLLQKNIETGIKTNGTKQQNLTNPQARIYSRKLVERTVQLDMQGTPKNILSNLILLDCVNPEQISFVKDRLLTKPDGRLTSKSPNHRVPLDLKLGDKRKMCFITPRIFSINTIKSPSTAEQILFASLCAWQCVQPTDILKLTSDDFAIKYNSQGRPTHIQCIYYKSRAHTTYSCPVISTQTIEGRALVAYINRYKNEDRLTPKLKSTQIIFAQDDNSDSCLLNKIWSSDWFINSLKKELKRSGNYSDCFRKAITALHRHGSITYSAWSKKSTDSGKNYIEYKSQVKNYLPTGWMSLGMIKTSSVYSNTDKYRDDDLTNQNSHSSETEKLYYLTENNYEWVNIHGRITRIALTYISDFAYKPNIEHSIKIATDKKIRTHILNVTGHRIKKDISISGEAKISQDYSINHDNIEPDHILVWDTVETVIIMRHYISEAERLAKILMRKVPEYFENNVLPTAEWMEWLIQTKLSPLTVKEGESSYIEIKSILPSLFSSEIDRRDI